MKKHLLYAIVFTLVVGTLFALGVWQWQRAQQKQAIMDNMQETRDFRGDSLLTHKVLIENNYAKVQLSGQWLALPSLLLENRHYQSKPGFHVLNAFRLISGQVILVNRGWHGVDNIELSARAALPKGQVNITGRLYQPKKGFTLGPAFANAFDDQRMAGKPIFQMQYYDFAAISQRLNISVLPIVVVLDSDAPDALVSTWQPVTVPASRHIGYALQWWGLSLVALIYAIIFHRRLRRKK